MSPIGITLLMAAAFAGFAYLAWRKLAIVVSLAPEVRWDHPLARIKRVLVDGLLQSRMIRGEPRAGIMHCVIFTGFLILLARKVQLIVVGYAAGLRLSGVAGRVVRGRQGFRRAGSARGGRLRVLSPLRAEARSARSESRGDSDPLADRGDHGDRSRVRRLPLRVVRGRRSGHRPRAQLCRGRLGAGVDVRRAFLRVRCAPACTFRTGCKC